MTVTLTYLERLDDVRLVVVQTDDGHLAARDVTAADPQVLHADAGQVERRQQHRHRALDLTT